MSKFPWHDEKRMKYALPARDWLPVMKKPDHRFHVGDPWGQNLAD